MSHLDMELSAARLPTRTRQKTTSFNGSGPFSAQSLIAAS